ncbi:hypothetical protein QVD17_29019 [Tagetes erecta]|uniref:Uncharacterized protein n=1 Tax=Tagetes erecta TaxID=13708 RepID=A0AAD8KBG5_TARER|nr:hypothetical protein QVD17_29019 [Tagetes erecta]
MNTHLSGPSSNLNGSHVSSIRHNAVLATSGIENTSHLKSGLISEGSKIGDLNRVRFGKIQSPPRQINMVSNKVNTANGVGVPMTVSLSHKKLKEDAQKEAPTRSEKKMMKKHTKYEKLIGSWLPPVFQAHLPDGGDDEDWLCRSKASSSLVSKGEVETCRQSMASWQPCARFLVEVDMHALPYTVPF